MTVEEPRDKATEHQGELPLTEKQKKLLELKEKFNTMLRGFTSDNPISDGLTGVDEDWKNPGISKKPEIAMIRTLRVREKDLEELKEGLAYVEELIKEVEEVNKR